MLVDGPRPVGERPALLGELRRLVVRLLVDERHEPVPEVERRLAVVRDPHPEQEIRPPHDAEADAPVGLDGLVDLRQRVRVHLDDVVEEPHGQPHHALELGPVDRPLPVRLPSREHGDVDGSQVARLVRQEGLLPAGIRRLDHPDLGRRVRGAGVDPVEEDHARVAGLPRGADDPVEHVAGGQPADHLAVVRGDQLVLLTLLDRVHEPVGRGHRDVEVDDAAVELALDQARARRDGRSGGSPCWRPAACRPASPPPSPR